MTYGEKAVGLTFNPGGNADVDMLKRKFAEVIDVMDELRMTARMAGNDEQARLASIAITEAQGAQMWAVKAVTWRV